MSLTNEEVDKQCNTLLTVFTQLIDLKDPAKLLEFFHPHAVLIHVGQSAKYGREELLEVMKEWVNMDAKIEAHPNKRLEAGHGDYLFDFGTMEFKFTDGNIWKCKYEFIYKREDGKYFLYRDQIDRLMKQKMLNNRFFSTFEHNLVKIKRNFFVSDTTETEV